MRLTEPQAAVYIGRSISTLRNWRLAGLLRPERDGFRLMYPTEQLEAARDVSEARYRNRPLPGRPRKDTAA